MAPETRSRGVPPPSRVYHSSPSLQQAQFPPRRKVVRTYGKHSRSETPSSSAAAARRDPRQKTLTQIDFVSSSMLSEAVVLSDSDEDEFASAAGDKENERPEDDEDEDEEEEPVQTGRKKRRANTGKGKDGRGKRRRTLGDENEVQQKTKEKTKKKDESRRRTLGDVPSSRYHTQTLTQFLGHDHEALIKDSEDEEDGFDDWLQAPGSPSPQPKSLRGSKKQTHDASISSKTSAIASEQTSRQSSIVPQTPTKRQIRYEIPSSSQQSTPASHMLNRYGAPDEEKPSPSIKSGKTQKLELVEELKGKPKHHSGKLVIEDSFATESWESSTKTPPAKGTPLKDITEEATGVGMTREESSSATEVMSTPTGPRRRRTSLELGQETPTKQSPAAGSAVNAKVQPLVATHAGLVEIPDSDEEDEGFSEDEEPINESTGVDESSDKENKTQPKPTKRVRIHSDIDKEKRESYNAGPETQFAMDALESSDIYLSGQASTQQPTQPSAASTDLPSSPQLPPPKPLQKPSKPLRKPRRNLPPTSHSQPLESQRVAFATIKGFGDHSDRTDILLILTPSQINPLVSGHEVDLCLPFKIPDFVERFWLFDGEYICYGACVEPGRVEQQDDGSQIWRYHVWQMYELNDPKDAEYISGEGWFESMPVRYAYVPPAGVSDLLSNLRHTLFGHEDEVEDETQADEHSTPQAAPPLSSARTATTTAGSSFSDSQQVEAQLRSDIAQHTQVQTSDPAAIEDAILVPSTPLKNKTRHSDTTPRGTSTQQPIIRPSQATTVSQVSTPEKQSSYHHILPPPPPTHSSTGHQERTAFPPPAKQLPPPSSSSVPTFPDMDGSSPSLMSNLDMSLRSSQLLTKSQMLPDSLLRDDARVPPEIWDSD